MLTGGRGWGWKHGTGESPAEGRSTPCSGPETALPAPAPEASEASVTGSHSQPPATGQPSDVCPASQGELAKSVFAAMTPALVCRAVAFRILNEQCLN